eukprot:scaffold76_cov363-Pavlova_lutheri.AAC.4
MSRSASNKSSELGSSSPVCPQPMAVQVVPTSRDSSLAEILTGTVPSSADCNSNSMTSYTRV